MRRALPWLAISYLLLAGCGGRAGPDVPEILYGEDICDRCRMVISEERHAAGALVEGREYRFDDPGCLREFLESESGGALAAAWVHDQTGSWLRAEEAWFVEDPERGTPMASGILAFGSEEAAAAAGRRHGGEPVRWVELAGRGETASE